MSFKAEKATRCSTRFIAIELKALAALGEALKNYLSACFEVSCPLPERMLATAARITGSKATVMANMGHFPMSENPALFKQYLMPVLDEIASR